MIINKGSIKNIPIVGILFSKFFWAIKYKVFNYLYLEPYYHICTIFRSDIGVNENNRNTLLIVSLTTIPERIDRVYLTIETLLQQAVKPDHIILWLSKSDFSIDYLFNRNHKTRRLLKLQDRGLTINFCKDIRSYTKIVYALKKHPKAIIVSADDDLYYPKNWLKDMYSSYLQTPEAVHCHMAYYMKKATDNSLLPYHNWLKPDEKFQGPSNNLFPFTGQGCLFPPSSLHDEVFNEKVFLKISPNHDDAWFKAMSLLSGYKIKKVKQISKHWQTVRGSQERTIKSIIVDQNQFDPQVKAIFDKYNLYNYLDYNDPT